MQMLWVYGLVLKLAGWAGKKLAKKTDNHIDDNIAEFLSNIGECISNPEKAKTISDLLNTINKK